MRRISASRIRFEVVAIIGAALLLIVAFTYALTVHAENASNWSWANGQALGMGGMFGRQAAEADTAVGAVDRMASLMAVSAVPPGVVAYQLYVPHTLVPAATAAIGAMHVSPSIKDAITKSIATGTPASGYSLYYEHAIPGPFVPMASAVIAGVFAHPNPAFGRTPSMLTAALPLVWHGQTIAVEVIDQVPQQLATAFNAPVIALLKHDMLWQLATIMLLVALIYEAMGWLVVRPIRYQAEHDAMTDVYNAMTFQSAIQRSANDMVARGLPISLLGFDLDHFKDINDRYGHTKGNEILVAFVNIVRRHCRNTDILGRMGGEEFGLLLPGCSHEQAQAIAERIRVDTHEIVLPDRHLSVSIGVACCEKSADIDRLIQAADIAMYHAKRIDGRDHVTLFRPGMEMPPTPA